MTVRHLNLPTKCDLCGSHIGNTLFDFKTIMGPWGNGCPDCFENYGGQLGTGRGQKYEKNAEDGHYYKVDG